MIRRVLTAEGPQGLFTVTGQCAKALAALSAAGAHGITALEVNSWAYRLGAYVHTLRHQHGLAIETVREPHDGGWHGRYVLRSPVALGEDDSAAKEAARGPCGATAALDAAKGHRTRSAPVSAPQQEGGGHA